MTDVGRVLIVGGGPAGMTAAIALARAGIAAEIVEIEDDWRPAGVGLLLQSPPLRALKTLGLYEGCVAAGEPHAAIDLFTSHGIRSGRSRSSTSTSPRPRLRWPCRA